MITSHWPATFRQLFGGSLPDTYICCDTETSGFNRTKDVIVQWGHCLVENRKVVERLSVMVN